MIAWRAVAAVRARSRKAKMALVSKKMVYEAGLVSRVFLAWQRQSYCEVVSREFREDLMAKTLRAAFTGWEMWSYKVVRVRWKWSVRKVQEWAFELFRTGSDVSRMERMVVFKRVWGRWVRQWQRRWKQEPVEMYERGLVRRVWREWSWYLGELGVERRCGFGGLGEGFFYRPMMSTNRALELERDDVLEKDNELWEEEMTWENWFAREGVKTREVAGLEDLRKVRVGVRGERGAARSEATS